MVPSLLRAVQIVIRADSDPARQALFTNLKQSRPAVRLVHALHDRLGPWGSALLVSCYGLASFLRVASPPNQGATVLTMARHANARHQVSRVAGWLGPGACAPVDTGFSPGAGASLVTALWKRSGRRRAVTVLRIVGAVDRRHGFLVSCRVACAVAWYARSMAIFKAHRPRAVLVSSDSNPEELGFTSAARAHGIPTVFVSHAYATPLSPPLDFSLSILEGEAAVRARQRKGIIKGDVVLAGLEGESAPLDCGRFERSEPVIGIFTPKGVAWAKLAEVIADCRQRFHARRIVIRWHPSMLEQPHLSQWVEDLSGIEETPASATLTDVAQLCDWVIADENSGVHLPVLKLGIPTVAVQRLGLYPSSRSDLYGFAAENIVFPPVSSVRTVTVEALTAFFSGDWAQRFERFDASYLRPPHAIGDEVRRAIWGLFETEGSKASGV